MAKHNLKKVPKNAKGLAALKKKAPGVVKSMGYMNKGGTMKKSKMMNKGGASMKKKTKYMSKGGAARRK